MNMQNQATMILDRVSIGYASGRGRRMVVDDINTSLFAGELTCLIGSNGVGKSTLLRTLAGFQPALGGDIRLLDSKGFSSSRSFSSFSSEFSSSEKAPSPSYRSLRSCTPRELARKIGIVLTGKPDVAAMRVEELLAIGRSPYTNFWGRLSPSDQAAVEDSISLVGIAQLRRRQFHTLSDGEKQKVMIAKALVQQTDIVLLDEPTAFLDYPSKVEVMQLLCRLAHELSKTILLSTHDIELALQIADKLWLLEGGTETAGMQGTENKNSQLVVGTPRQLADDGHLSRFIDRDGIWFDTSSLRINVLSVLQ